MNSHQAKKIPLTEILSRLGHHPAHQKNDEWWYQSPLRAENVASFSVNTQHNIWYDFGEGRGGDGIDFIQAYYNLTDVSAALAQLQRLMEQAPVHPKPLPRPFAKPQSSPLEVRHIGALKNRALIRYLKQRGISVKTATPYLKEIYYARGSNNYFALAFANESGGYEMRNPYFKGVYGTKAISVIGKRDLRSKKK